MTSESHATGFGDQEADSLADMQFNFPYQVAAAVVGGERGPNWYRASTAERPELHQLMQKVWVSSDDECERIDRETGNWMSKVAITTADGRSHSTAVETVDPIGTGSEIREKFLTTCEQVSAAIRQRPSWPRSMSSRATTRSTLSSMGSGPL